MFVLPETSWRAANAESRYPFSDSSTLTTEDGLSLPRSAVIDAAVYPPAAGPFRVAQIETTAERVVFGIGAAGREILATGTYVSGSGDTAVRLVTPAGAAAGVLVVDPVPMAALAAWPAGTHRLKAAAAEFVPAVCLPLAGDGLAGFVCGGEVLGGEVYLVGENGVVLSVEDGLVRVDVVGEPLFKRTACEPALVEAGHEDGGMIGVRYVRSINGAGGDAYGGVTLTPYVDTSPDHPDRSAVRINGVTVSLADAPEKTS